LTYFLIGNELKQSFTHKLLAYPSPQTERIDYFFRNILSPPVEQAVGCLTRWLILP